MNARHKILVGKGLPTVVYALILVLICCTLTTSHAFATCQLSDKCNNDTSGNDSLSYDQYSNSTLLLDQFSNATSPGTNSNLSFDQFSNSTSMTGNNTLVLQENLTITDTVTANDTNQTLPDPMESFQFAPKDASSTGANPTNSDSSLHLQGEQYVDENSTAPNLPSLTVSAWIKPDYSQGSPVFTVVSDENAFVLAVNNNIPTSKAAVFSIFDGIKWITVQSTSLIPEQWTHLAATFNGTTIGIYVNGNLEKTTHVTAVPVLVDGYLTTKTKQNLTSDANVTIGAYYEKTRMQTRDLFSGEISNVNLYDIAMTQEQIEQMFHNTKPSSNSAHYN